LSLGYMFGLSTGGMMRVGAALASLAAFALLHTSGAAQAPEPFTAGAGGRCAHSGHDDDALQAFGATVTVKNGIGVVTPTP
jgi:hypothetical protein